MAKQIENLTPKEFDLLMVMAKHQRQVFTREHLLTKIWKILSMVTNVQLTLTSRNFAKKSKLLVPHVIHTVWGVGYKF